MYVPCRSFSGPAMDPGWKSFSSRWWLTYTSTGVFGTAVLNFTNGQDIGNHFVSALTAAGATSARP